MKVYLINPKERTITEDIILEDESLEAVLDAYSVDFIELKGVPSGTSLAFDEDAQQIEEEPVFQIKGHIGPLRGNAVLLHIDRNRDFTDCILSLDRVKDMVSFAA